MSLEPTQLTITQRVANWNSVTFYAALTIILYVPESLQTLTLSALEALGVLNQICAFTGVI